MTFSVGFMGPEKSRYRFRVTVLSSRPDHVKIYVRTNIQSGGVAFAPWGSVTASHKKAEKRLTNWMIENIDKAMGVS